MCPITAEIMRDPVSTADGASAAPPPLSLLPVGHNHAYPRLQPHVSRAATACTPGLQPYMYRICIPGHTFERVAIERWLRTHGTSPMTGAALPHKHLVPAISLRQLIVEFSGAGADD